MDKDLKPRRPTPIGQRCSESCRQGLGFGGSGFRVLGSRSKHRLYRILEKAISRFAGPQFFNSNELDSKKVTFSYTPGN